jgi:Uma2 family endonuclease
VDNLFAGRQQKLLTEPLDSSWPGPGTGVSFLAIANVGLYFGIKQPPLVPDILLSVNVTIPANIWAKSGRSYFVWEYGKAPDVAIEIVSDTRGGEDSYKMQQYARGGVTYYVIWDPAHYLNEEALRIFVLRDGAYVRLEQPWLQAVGLGLTIWHGQYAGIEADWLRWCDQNGQVIPTGKERAEHERQAKEQATQRAEQERQRAEQERQAKEEAIRRAELLAARLRALGIDPNA